MRYVFVLGGEVGGVCVFGNLVEVLEWLGGLRVLGLEVFEREVPGCVGRRVWRGMELDWEREGGEK